MYGPCKKFRRDKGLTHRFDPISGWCHYGCGEREDGRKANGFGSILNTGPTYTTEELDAMRERANTRSHA